MALPFITLPSVEVALSLQTRLCRLAYDGRYIANDFGGEIEDIDVLTKTWARELARRPSKKKRR